MKGLELSRAYYEAYGRPMLEREFPDVRNRIAVGLAGHGSECFGFDDGISRDHDFEPGFCLWITEEDDRAFGFRLFRAYRRLPGEFEGIRLEKKSLFGSETKGVHTIREFYAFYTGTGDVPETNRAWLAVPEHYLAEATNGEVFSDPLGEFTRIRTALKDGMPEDVRRKKLASSLFYMAQMGQYNYERCLRHGEKTAAAECLAGFARHTALAVFLLNCAHAPYYKWRYRAMAALPVLGDLAGALETLAARPLEGEANGNTVEEICARVAAELRRQGLSDQPEAYLEPHAYRVNEGIRDLDLRSDPVMLPAR